MAANSAEPPWLDSYSYREDSKIQENELKVHPLDDDSVNCSVEKKLCAITETWLVEDAGNQEVMRCSDSGGTLTSDTN